MARPRIQLGNKTKKAVGARRQEETSVKELAEQAVQTFEQERELLEQMQAEFEEKFSDAAEFLQTIKQQEDTVMNAIADAKSLVSQAGETVGDFICKRKHSKPRYNDDRFTKLVGQEADGETVVELVQGGHVKKIALADSATAWFASHPQAAEAYQEAWDEKKELTAAVTVPKLG
jgi:uncharacterized membrane-anchored protein YhcB (DUF1043 family)